MRRLSDAVTAAVVASLGADEILLALALALVVVGLWPLVGRVALFVPGAVLLWIALPSRQPFVHRSPTAEKKSPSRRVP